MIERQTALDRYVEILREHRQLREKAIRLHAEARALASQAERASDEARDVFERLEKAKRALDDELIVNANVDNAAPVPG